MKQNIKKVLLVLCMAVCFFALTACSGSKKESEPVPETIVSTMKTGAENYLKEFDSYDDETLATTLKRVQKQKNTVMESAITSWQSSKADLGRLVSVLSEDVERVDEETYKITVRASYEQRELDFVLTAEEVVSDNYGGTSLAATEMVFTPIFTTGEKLERAAMNTRWKRISRQNRKLRKRRQFPHRQLRRQFLHRPLHLRHRHQRPHRRLQQFRFRSLLFMKRRIWRMIWSLLQ